MNVYELAAWMFIFYMGYSWLTEIAKDFYDVLNSLSRKKEK